MPKQFSLDVLCRHLGEQLNAVGCGSCGGKTRIKTFACNLHSQCSIGVPVPGHACCNECPDYSPKAATR